MKFKILYSIFILVNILSCRKLVEEEFSSFSSAPVVNSTIVADSIPSIHLSTAEMLGDEQLPVISDVSIFLFEDGNLFDTLDYYTNGFYRGHAELKQGKTYTAEIELPGINKTLVCADSIPIAEPILEYEHISIAGNDQEGSNYSAIKVSFPNDISRISYHELVIFMRDYKVDPIFIHDPVLLDEGLPIAVFSNESIQEDTYTMTINYYNEYVQNPQNQDNITLQPIIIEFRTISYDYYQYLKSYYLYYQGRYPNIVGGVVTVYPLHTNIDEGYGIFAGYSSVSTDTIYPEPIKIQ